MQKAELTKRKKEILRLIVRELHSKEIAQKLNISFHTVQSHRRNIFEKLQAKSIIALVNYAHKKNLHKF